MAAQRELELYALQQQGLHREQFMQQRLNALWAEVDAAARASLRTAQPDPMPAYLNQMPGGAGAHMGEQQRYGAVVPRVQESRHLRRQAVSPLDRPQPVQPRVATEASLQAEARMAGAPAVRRGMMPSVGPTPSTSAAVLDRPDDPAPTPAANGAAKDDDLSHDEAASLLLALPMSREPSGLDRLASPRVNPLPMSKTLSGISVSGFASFLEDDRAAPSPRLRVDPSGPMSPRLAGAPSPRLPSAAPWSSSSRLPGIPMAGNKSDSIISVTGFLNDIS